MPTRTNKRTGEVQSSEDGVNWVTVTPARVPAAAGPAFSVPGKPAEPKFVPGAPGFVMKPDGTADRIPGVPVEQKPEPAPKFIPDNPGYVLGPDGRAKPIPGLPPKAPNGKDDANSSKTRADALKQYNSATTLRRQAQEIEKLYGEGPGKTSGIRGFTDFLPSAANSRLDIAGQRPRAFIKGALGLTGGEGNTVGEMQINYDPYLPNSWDRNETAVDKIAAIRQLADDAERNAMTVLGGRPDAQGNILPIGQAAPPPPPPTVADYSNMSGGGNSFSQEGAQLGDRYRSEFDAEGSAFVNQAIRNGVPYREAISQFRRQFPNSNPFPPDQYNEALKHARDPKNKDYKGSYGYGTKQVPMGEFERRMNNLANSPGGAMLGKFGNALGGGIPGMFAGDEGAYALERMQQNHPTESMIGEFGGNVGGMLGTSGALKAGGSALGMSALMARNAGKVNALGDATYGATYGATQSPGDRGMGALFGGAAALGGNVAGNAGARAVGGLISPTGGKLGALYDMGARPSIGQRFGGYVNKAEEKLQSLPIVGDAIAGTRQRARDQGERGIFNDALAEVNELLPDDVKLGGPAHAYKQEVENRVYDEARAGMQMLPDGQLSTDLGSLQRTVGQLPEAAANRFNRIWQDEVVRRMKSGALTGDAYKKAQSELGKRIRKVRLSDPELADALGDASLALDGAARRSSPADAVAKLDQADRFYAKGVRIDVASNYAGGEAGRMTPSQYLRAVKNEDGSLRGRGFNAGNALNQDIAEQFARLGDAVPNSGTFDRLALGSAAVGGGAWDPTGIAAGTLGTLGILNAPIIRNATTGLLAPRKNKKLRDLAEGVRGFGPLLGTMGAGGLLSSQ